MKTGTLFWRLLYVVYTIQPVTLGALQCFNMDNLERGKVCIYICVLVICGSFKK